MRERAPPHVRRGWVAAQLGLAVLIAAPFVLTALDRAWLLPTLTRMLAYALGAAALDLVLGYGGLVSFGHGAFLGTGAYVAGALIHHAGARTPLLTWPVVIDGSYDALIAFPAAALVAGALAFLIGAVSLRTRGVHFIMITLAFAQMTYYFAISWPAYGGEDGLSITLRNAFPGVNTLVPINFFLICYGLLAAALVLFALTRDSRFGAALQAARQNEVRVATVGIAPYRIRLAAFVISGMVTALAGALYADLNRFVSPSMLSWHMSGELIVLIILGGVGRLAGPVAGAMLFVLFEFLLGGLTERWQFFLGLALLGVVLFARGGLVGLLVGRPRHG